MIKTNKQLEVTQGKIRSLKAQIELMKAAEPTVFTKGSIIETKCLIEDLEREVKEYLSSTK